MMTRSVVVAVVVVEDTPLLPSYIPELRLRWGGCAEERKTLINLYVEKWHKAVFRPVCRHVLTKNKDITCRQQLKKHHISFKPTLATPSYCACARALSLLRYLPWLLTIWQTYEKVYIN